jgi:excisionase family DNA binding protein
MTDLTQTVERLRETSDELKRRGIDDLARALDHAITDLNSSPLLASANLMTTGEAARILGVRSVNTVKRWAADGILDGFRRGGRILVTRASVEALLNDARLARHKAREKELDEVLAIFDIGDEPLPPSEALWEGKKPWENHGERANPTAAR